MERGISLSNDLFNKNRLAVFFFEEELGAIETVGNTLMAQPLNVKKAVPVVSTDQGIEYLMNYRNANIKPKQTAKSNPAQVDLFA